VAVLVAHDRGCRHARPDGGGHTDAAKRLSDHYNLHKVAGGAIGQVFAVALADGTSDGTLYGSRHAAVIHQRHSERNYAYIRLSAPSMSVCEAEAVMYMQRSASRLGLTDRDDPHGGLEIIPRLTQEHQLRQLEALRGGIAMPVAVGYSREVIRES